MLSSLRQMRLLEHRHATLSQFFSPVVLDTLAVEDPEVVLAPRETEVSVLFCDLRGFSRESERQAGDLLGLLQRVSRALGVMTHHIREAGRRGGRFPGRRRDGLLGLAPAAERRRAAHLPRRPGRAGRVRGHHRLSRRHRRGHGQGRGRQDRHRRPGESHGLRPGGEPCLAAGRDDQDPPRPDPAGRRPPPGSSAGKCRARWPECGGWRSSGPTASTRRWR